MKKITIKLTMATLVLLSTFALHPLSSRAQGSLTPPGAPAPTMKTLAQIEARTPVDATNTPGTAFVQFVINQPGSYYLTGNISAVNKTGITIQTNDVTLDLNGFAMTFTGPVSTYNAIAVVGQVAQNNVVIRNGTLRGWASGVSAPGGYCELDHVRVYGCVGNGIQIGNYCTVKNCTAVSNGGNGLQIGNFCIVKDCLASSNYTDGIYGGSDCLVSGCHADNNASDGIVLSNNFNASQGIADGNIYGFSLLGYGRINDCTANANSSYGIATQSGCFIKDCVASTNLSGISCYNNCLVINNSTSGNTQNGIGTVGSGNRIENNYCCNNQSGIFSFNGPGADIIVRNTCVGNSGGNYYPTNGTTFAPIQTPATATNPNANF